MKIAKIIIPVAAIIVIAVLAVKLLSGKTTDSSSAVYVQAVNSVNSAESGNSNRFSGVVVSQKSEGVKLDTEQTLKECKVKEGDEVKEGDVLFSYDTEQIDLEIQQKEIAIEKLNSTIENDNTQITSLTESMNKAEASEQVEFSSQILELQAEVAQSEYDIKVAKSEIEKLEAKKKNADVTSPMDGTVTKIVDPSDITEENSAYITVTADGQFRVKGTINEQNISDISEGMSVLMRSRVDETKTWTGTVSLIDTQPEESSSEDSYFSTGSDDSSSSKYSFYVELDSVDGLMLGQHLTIEKDLGIQNMDGIWLESGWIVTEDDGSTYCWAASSAEGTLEKRKVEIGENDEENGLYQIVSGLQTTDYIAWPDYSNAEGMQVTTTKVSETEESSQTETESVSEENYTDDSGYTEYEDTEYDDSEYDDSEYEDSGSSSTESSVA